MRIILFFLTLVFSLGLLSGCQNAKYLKSHSDAQRKHKRVFDEYWVVKNTIENPKKKLNEKKNKPIVCEDSVLINPQDYTMDSDLASEIYYDLYGMLRQQPNRVFVFGRPLLWIYNLSDTMRIRYDYDPKLGSIAPDTINLKGYKPVFDSVKTAVSIISLFAKDSYDPVVDTTTTLRPKDYEPVYYKSKLRRFFMTRMGEAPVIYDSIKTMLTARSMQNYLMQRGFLNARVGYEVKFNKHKATVSYYYTTGKPLLIDSLIYESEDPALKRILEEVKSESALKVGQPMDKNAFLQERTRLTLEIRNRGYYGFNWNYISYIADTANASKISAEKGSTQTGLQGEPRAHIYVTVLPFSDTVKSHNQYYLKDVYIILDEPKVEIHKIKRRYIMDTSFVVLQPPRKKQEVSNMYKTLITEEDSLTYFHLETKEGNDVMAQLSKQGTRAILVNTNSKYPYWIRLRKQKGNVSGLRKGSVKVDAPHKVTFMLPREGKKSIAKSGAGADFVISNPVNDAWYKVALSPYRRRFVRKSYKQKYEISDEDIPIHIVLRKPIKTAATDSLKKIKEEAKLRKENFVIRDQVISQNVQIRSGGTYSYTAARETVNRISELELFKLPRVEFVPSKSGNKNELDAYVYMQKSKVQGFGADTDFNSSNANLGWAVNLNYKNRNVFKGAEVFVFDVEGGINFNLKPDTSNAVKGIVQWINLLDLNSSLSLYFPKIVGFRNWTLSVDRPKTKISIAYHYLQQSTDFRVSSFDAMFGYEWSLKNRKHVFAWNPFALNFTLEPILSPNFDQRLKNSNFALWASLKDRYFVPGNSFSYQYLPKSLKSKHLLTLKIFAEATGNSAYLIDLVKPGADLNFLGTPYSQYLKGDLDLRYTWKPVKRHILATRLMAGAAVPIGKSTRVPYSRQFFLGGPSSMRGWNMRELGPGRVRPVQGAEFQLGDIRLEMNAEYRFMFNSWIGGALFVDAGNIWLAKDKSTAVNPPLSKPESGVFSLRFMEELAMDIGTGLRLDMSFFVIRLDLAIPVRNPAGFGWVDADGLTQYTYPDGFPRYWKFDWLNTNWLLAVGYPF